MENKICLNCGFVDRLEVITAWGGQFEDPNQECEECGSKAYELLASE